MTTSVRYKNVENSLGVPFTLGNFPYITDGDDKQLKFIKRTIVAADIGTAAGQIGNASGAILDIVPPTTNILWVQGSVFRPQTPVGGAKPYQNIQGLTFPIVTPLTQVNVQFMLGLDNTIRAIDVSQGGTAALAAGDVITAFVLIGQKPDAADSMN